MLNENWLIEKLVPLISYPWGFGYHTKTKLCLEAHTFRTCSTRRAAVNINFQRKHKQNLKFNR